MEWIHALNDLLDRIPSLSGLNAVLFCLVAYFAHQKVMALLKDLQWAVRRIREHEATFLKYGMEVERGPDEGF